MKATNIQFGPQNGNHTKSTLGFFKKVLLLFSNLQSPFCREPCSTERLIYLEVFPNKKNLSAYYIFVM